MYIYAFEDIPVCMHNPSIHVHASMHMYTCIRRRILYHIMVSY